MPLFKTSLEARVKGLVLNVDYLENQHRNFTQKKYGRKTGVEIREICTAG